MSPAVLLPVLFVLLAIVCGTIGYTVGRASAPAALTDAAGTAERDAFIEHLRELAWQHRDVSPELSTIIIDEIAQRHRRGHGQLPGASS